MIGGGTAGRGNNMYKERFLTVNRAKIIIIITTFDFYGKLITGQVLN